MQVLLLKQPYSVSFSGMPMPFSFVISPYNAAATKQDLTILVRVLIEDASGSGIYIEAHSQTFFPDPNGQINIDVQSQIHPYLSYYLPRLNQPQMVVANGQYKKYQLAYSLQQGGVAITTENVTVALSAIKGGMAYAEWHPTEVFTNYLQSQKNFLCFTTPREKFFPEANSFLFFLAPVTGSYTCGTTMVDDSGNNYALPMANAINLAQNAVACLPSGFEQLGLHAILPAGAFAIQYTVTIATASLGVIASRTFKLDYRNFYNTSTIVYRNSLGGLETVVLRGQIDFLADYAIQQAQRITPPSYFENSILLPQQEQLTDETPKFNGDTGFNDRETTEKLRDYFDSTQRLEIKNGKWIPINNLNKSVSFYGNKDNLISIQLQWQHAFTNEYFTPYGVMPLTRSCPALESLQVTQANKSTLQIMWAAPIPYDLVQINIIVNGTTYTYDYTGNTGCKLQPFINPAVVGGTANVVIQGRVICDPDALPMPDLGPASTVTMQVIGNSLPVLTNDTFTVNSGLTTAVPMANSVLDNDYDPDGDPLVVVAATGSTNAGGTYTIDIAGNVTYQPPTASYNGTDYVDYLANDGTGANVTARIFFVVGGSVTGIIFAKSFTKNTSTTSPASNVKQTIGEFWIGTFSDPAGQNPLDVTGLGLVVNYNHNVVWDAPATNPSTSVPGSVVMTGTAVKVYQGLILEQQFILVNGGSVNQTVTFPIQAGSGYTPL